MKHLIAVAFGVLVGLLASGLILATSRRPAGEPISLLPLPTLAPLQVDVAGAVVSPGVYTLDPGARVQQAIEAAGGAVPGADLEKVNLAATVEDGSQIVVPKIQPTRTPFPTFAPDSRAPTIEAFSSTTPAFTPTPTAPIDINTATQAELEWLPGIGPVYARAILTYRETNGPFKKIEDILDVPGIGPKTFEKFKDLITISEVDPEPQTPSPTPHR